MGNCVCSNTAAPEETARAQIHRHPESQAHTPPASREPENTRRMHTSPDASFANQLRSPPVLTIPQSTPTLPPRPEFIPFTVPLLRASEPYDRKDFWTFPNRHGWLVHLGEEQCEPLCPPSRSTYRRAPLNAKGPTSKLSRADGSPVTSTSKAAFLQNWLFFGVLHEVSRMCRLSIDVEAEFINDFGRTSLSTAALNGLASRWFRSLDNKEVGETVFMAEILSVGRLTASLISEEVTQSGEPVFEYTPDEVRVFLSIDVLARTIGLHLLMHVYSPGFSFPEHEGWDRRRISESIDWFDRCVEGMNAKFADHLRDELIRQGWCINEVSLIPRDCLFFTTLLDRPRAKDHSGCGMVACGAYQTDEATYKTVHTHDLCDGSCEFVRVPTADLVGLLSQGKVPAVIIADVGSIQVVDSSDYPYIALSHVWADGLGNPNDNALPSCQLRRLRGYTKQLSEAHPWQDMPGGHKSVVAFWMDTLCIPVDPRMKQYRTKAIQLLEKTFHDAAAVLVLDRELEIVNSTTTPFLELGIRILCSGWAKRLWTLQESTLAGGAQSEDKIYFQMYDGPFLHQKLNQNRRRAVLDEFGRPEHLLEEHAMLFQSNLIWSLGGLIPSLHEIRSLGNLDGTRSRFVAIYDAIEGRTTSKAEDVPLCMASILGRDVAPILSARGIQGRFSAFYLVMRDIPEGVLWLEGAEKLAHAPFRWAPISLADPFSRAAYSGWPDTICDEHGLHVQHSGFLLEDAGTLPNHFRLVSPDASVVYGVLQPSSEALCVVTLELGTQLAIITRPLGRSGLPDGFPNAAVVSITPESRSVKPGVSTDTEIRCTVVGYGHFSPVDLDIRPMAQEVIIHGTPIVESQKWCIT